ncbi:DUF2207 family protein [Frateuria sp. GZRR35]|uniref:DUF2207 family protein n=1 Tax=Frateuria sp. GZRR35 TaxID=3351536 RepID=UPI003EDB8E67
MRVLLLAWLALVATGVHAQYAGQDNGKPDIISRDASIQVNDDDSITVTETTRVGRAAPLPFHRDLALGNRNWSASDVTVLEATQNGEPVETQVDDHAGGVRISTGSTGAEGTREYTLVYRLGHAVVHYGDGDRLDWPVASRSNPLELRDAQVKVLLPDGTAPQRTRAWFRLGTTDLGSHWEENRVRGDEVSLYWPSGLGAGQTLSVAVTYPHGGAAAVPGNASKTPGMAAPPRWVFDGRVWLALLVAYYLAVKFLFTGSAQRKAVIAEYGPPGGYSAAALRLLWHQAYDDKCLAAGILGIAAKGGLCISREADGSYVATRAGDEVHPGLTMDEHILRSSLFTLAPSVAFTRQNADGLDLVESRFRAVLEQRCSRERTASPDTLLLPGWLVVMAALGFLYFGGRDPLQLAAQLIASVAVAGIAVVTLVRFVPHGLLRAIRLQAGVAVAICAAAWATGVDPANGVWMAVLLAAQIFAGWWLPRLPPRDTELLRKLRGFRWYLATAEQQDMDARYKPSLHPELQASLLPYAMALDVEVAWNRRFAGTLQQAGEQGFVTELSQRRAGHTEAAVDLLAFARAMSKSRSTQA